MRIRRPKKPGPKKLDIESKEKPKKKTPVDATKQRSRFPSKDLVPLDKYEPYMNSTDRDRWLKTAIVYMRAFVAEGLSREEIKGRLSIEDTVYDMIETRLVEHDGAKFTNMGTAHRYYFFALRMEQCARELDDFVRMHMEDDPRKSGVVGAIKAKAQIHKDVMTMGQDLGIIAKRAKEMRLLGELNLNLVETDELKEMFEEKMQQFRDIVQGTPVLPSTYSQILDNATQDGYNDADAIIDAEYTQGAEDGEGREANSV